MKKTTRGLIALGILIVIAGAALIGSQLYQDKKSADTYKKITADYTKEGTDAWYDALQVDFETLQGRNRDVIGWLVLEGSDVISYPILQGEDDEEYLHHNLLGEELKAGSIFLEASNSSDFSDSYSIIYGHNMRNGSMFGTLKDYHNEGYFEAHPYITIYTPNEAYRYAIFAYEEVEASDRIYTVGYIADEVFEEFLQYIEGKSEKDIPVEVHAKDQVITLSTCSTNGRRFVLHGVKIDTHVY